MRSVAKGATGDVVVFEVRPRREGSAAPTLRWQEVSPVQRPKLLVLASTYPRRPGDGTPAFVRDLALAEAARYDTTVLVPAVPGASLSEADGALGVRRFRYFPRRWEDLADGAILENLRARPVRWLQVVPFMLAETFAVWRAVRRQRPDVIHVHWLVPQGLAALIAAPRTPKLVTTLGGDLYGLRGPVSRLLIRAVIKNAGSVTTMNSQMRDKLIELGADPAVTHILPMGADLAAVGALTASADRKRGRILFVGRLVEKKGLAVLVEAMRSLPGSGVELVVVGDGPLRSELERQAVGLPVRFVGTLDRPALAAEYAAASVAVFPSVPAASGDQDGLPVALLEAMGAGCPIVASSLPGLDEAVIDGESGVLVAPGSVPELQAALHRLLADEPLRSSLGAGAAIRAQEYSVDSIGRRYIALLDAIAAGTSTESAI